MKNVACHGQQPRYKPWPGVERQAGQAGFPRPAGQAPCAGQPAGQGQTMGPGLVTLVTLAPGSRLGLTFLTG